MRQSPEPTGTVAAGTWAGSPVDPRSVRAQSADLYVNSTCNLACTTCFLGDDYFHTGAEMSVADAGSIGSWCVRAGVRDIAVLGGEPTVHPDITNIFVELRRAGVDHLRLVTNGNRRARQYLRGDLGELVDLVYVSLDGATPEVNDAVRGRGSFREAIECVDLLASLGKPFVITSTLTREAVKQLDRLVELAVEKGALVLNLHWLSSVGRARGTNLALSSLEWSAVCELVANLPPVQGLVIECQVAWKPLREGASWTQTIDANACAVRDFTNLEFLPDGRVFACGLLVDDTHRHGFRWEDGSLIEQGGETERSLCCSFTGNGCPVRQVWLDEPSVAGQVPVCIYERIVVDGR